MQLRSSIALSLSIFLVIFSGAKANADSLSPSSTINKKKKKFTYWNKEIGQCRLHLSVEDKLEQQARIFGDPSIIPSSSFFDKMTSDYLKPTHWDGYIWNNPYSIFDVLKLKQAKEDAETIFRKYFSQYSDDPNSTDDEGDAFRHFVFSSLMRKRFSRERAEYYLGVHEKGEITMSSFMDRYNNQIALNATERRMEEGKEISFEYLGTEALRLIKSGTLVVINPKRDIPGAQINRGDDVFRRWADAELDNELE